MRTLLLSYTEPRPDICEPSRGPGPLLAPYCVGARYWFPAVGARCVGSQLWKQGRTPPCHRDTVYDTYRVPVSVADPRLVTRRPRGSVEMLFGSMAAIVVVRFTELSVSIRSCKLLLLLSRAALCRQSASSSSSSLSTLRRPASNESFTPALRRQPLEEAQEAVSVQV